MNLRTTLTLFFVLVVAVVAQEYNGPTTAGDRDLEVLSLRKINKILSDSKAGTSPLATSGASASMASSTALEASHVIKASAGTLISLVGFNNSGSAQYIQLHNAISLPANAAVPKYTFKVEAGANFSIDVPITGAPFSTGIVVCNSSTVATKTLGSADCFFTAVYR